MLLNKWQKTFIQSKIRWERCEYLTARAWRCWQWPKAYFRAFIKCCGNRDVFVNRNCRCFQLRLLGWPTGFTSRLWLQCKLQLSLDDILSKCMPLPYFKHSCTHDADVWPLTFKTFSAIWLTWWIFVVSCIEIRPASTEIPHHVKQVSTNGQWLNE